MLVLPDDPVPGEMAVTPAVPQAPRTNNDAMVLIAATN
jgi:hypothetical protein